LDNINLAILEDPAYRLTDRERLALKIKIANYDWDSRPWHTPYNTGLDYFIQNSCQIDRFTSLIAIPAFFLVEIGTRLRLKKKLSTDNKEAAEIDV
jgi:hypothetical protein